MTERPPTKHDDIKAIGLIVTVLALFLLLILSPFGCAYMKAQQIIDERDAESAARTP